MDIYFVTQFLYEFVERTTNKSLHSGVVEIYHQSKLIGKDFSTSMKFDFTNESHLKTSFTRFIIGKLEGISKHKPSLKAIMKQNCSVDICQLENKSFKNPVTTLPSFNEVLVLKQPNTFIVNSYALNSALLKV